MDSMTYVSLFFGSILALIVFIQHIKARKKARQLAKHGMETGSLLPGEKHVVYTGQCEDHCDHKPPAIEYNPTNGLLLGGCVDVAGNMTGTNKHE